MYISVPPVPFWSCLYQKNTTSFRMYKTVCFEHETHVKSTRRKRLRTPSRTNLRWYIAHHPRLPTLPSRKQTSLWRPAQQECTSQGAPTYPYFSKPLKNIFFQSHQSPSCLAYTRKTLQVFRIHKAVWFEHENTFQNYQPKKVPYIIQNSLCKSEKLVVFFWCRQDQKGTGGTEIYIFHGLEK